MLGFPGFSKNDNSLITKIAERAERYKVQIQNGEKLTVDTVRKDLLATQDLVRSSLDRLISLVEANIPNLDFYNMGKFAGFDVGRQSILFTDNVSEVSPNTWGMAYPQVKELAGARGLSLFQLIEYNRFIRNNPEFDLISATWIESGDNPAQALRATNSGNPKGKISFSERPANERFSDRGCRLVYRINIA